MKNVSVPFVVVGSSTQVFPCSSFLLGREGMWMRGLKASSRDHAIILQVRPKLKSKTTSI